MSRSLYMRLRRRFGPRISGAERKDRIERRIGGHKAELPIDERLLAKPSATAAPKAGKPRAIVIGAGFAGLTAAVTLSGEYQVTVLEARDRVGGRVWTLPGENGRLTEGGAELIGYAHTLWMAMANDFELGLSVLTSDDDSAAMGLELPLYLMGHMLSASELQTVYEEMDKIYDEMARKAEVVTNTFAPWTTPDAQHLDNTNLRKWLEDHSPSALTMAAMESDWANNNGRPTDQQSYLANLSLIAGCRKHGHYDDYFNFTENCRCESGNHSLATALAGRVTGYGGEVLLSTPVASIDLSGSIAVVNAPGGPYEADVVVLATPITAWPAIDPEPGADCRVAQGDVVKYLSDTPRRFWIPEGLSPSSVSERYGMTWEGTDNQIGYQPEFSLFAGGPAADDALLAWEQGDVHAFYDTTLNEVYAGYPANRLDWPRFMPWPREPWTWTGYSCPRPGDVCGVWPSYAQAFGPGGKLWFAGEHTSPAFFGYMEGALEGGFFTGLRILGWGG